MAEKVLSTPSIIINNENIKIKPSSFTYNDGQGETQVRAQSTGGGGITTVAAVDASTKISIFKFTLEPTNSNADLVRGWKANFNQNAVIATEDDGFVRTFTSAAVTNVPEIGMSVDGEIALEWASDPAS